MAGIEQAFEKFVKKISDIEEKDTEDNSNFDFGKNVYAPQDGLFFSPVQKNQIPFGDILKSDQRLNPPMPTPTQRNLTSEERMRLEDNEYFMGQGQPQYVSPVVQGQGFNKRDLKDFTKQYLQSQTPLGGGIGYQGPEYGVVAIKPFVGPDRSALLQGYYNTDNEGSRIQAGLSPKEQRIDYTGNTGTTFSAGRNTYQGNPYYTFNVNKPFADGGVASMFRERPGYQVGGNIDPLALQRSPIDQYGYSDPVISALTGNIFTSGQRFRDVFNPQAGLMMQQAQAAGYSEPEMEELRHQQDFFPSFQRGLNEAYFGPTFQADPQKSAIDLATSIYNQRFQAPPSVQQQRPQTQYQYSSKGTPILQYGYTGTPSIELQSQIDLQKRALDRLESIYNKPMANIGGDERVHAFGNTGGYKYNQNELLQNILKSEQDAAARVTPTRMAYGGRADYAEGSKPTREDSPILQINPMERDIQFSQDPTMDQIPNVGIAAIGLTKKAKEYNRYIKAFESNDPKVFKKWFDSQTKEFSKTKKLAEDAEMFELIPEVARGASKTEKQIANKELRENMGKYYEQELGPYFSQEIGILDDIGSQIKQTTPSPKAKQLNPDTKIAKKLKELEQSNFEKYLKEKSKTRSGIIDLIEESELNLPKGSEDSYFYENNPGTQEMMEYVKKLFDIKKADGGRVSMSDGGLTTMIAPAKGPDSQGVESLFRRRYN